MSGPGVTRIDTVMCNDIGAQLVGGVSYLWETSGANDHVGIAVRLNKIKSKLVTGISLATTDPATKN